MFWCRKTLKTLDGFKNGADETGKVIDSVIDSVIQAMRTPSSAAFARILREGAAPNA